MLSNATARNVCIGDAALECLAIEISKQTDVKCKQDDVRS